MNYTQPNLEPTFIPRKVAVLIIDDDTSFCEALSDILSTVLNIPIYTAANGLAGLQIFQEQQNLIALIILDVEMPVMNGAQTYAKLQQLVPETKVVVSSGLTFDAAQLFFGAQALPTFLQKPYGMQTLLDVVQAELKET